jgi:hypothetical protein
VTTNRADDTSVPPDRGTESLDEQARRKGIRPIQSADDLVQDGVFDTDEELDASSLMSPQYVTPTSPDHLWANGPWSDGWPERRAAPSLRLTGRLVLGDGMVEVSVSLGSLIAASVCPAAH